MSDFGEFFDAEKLSKREADRKAHEDIIARSEAAKAEAIARRKPLVDVVEPVLERAERDLASRGVVVQRKLVLKGYDIGQRPFVLFQLQSKNGQQPPSSVYLFQLYPSGHVSVTECDHKVDFRNSDKQLVRLELSQFNTAVAEEMVRRAIGEFVAR